MLEDLTTDLDQKTLDGLRAAHTVAVMQAARRGIDLETGPFPTTSAPSAESPVVIELPTRLLQIAG
jgi:hypothetical protein